MTRIGTLDSTEHISGVNEDLAGFVQIRAQGQLQDGTPVVLLGQLDPAALRQAALHMLEAAEAAESDALVARALTELDLEQPFVGQFLVRLREIRHADD